VRVPELFTIDLTESAPCIREFGERNACTAEDFVLFGT
jgi:hypothetical protein